MPLLPLFLRQPSLRRGGATTIWIALILATNAANSASFQGLGHLPSSEALSQANAISADGRVVVGVASSGRRGFQAFRWEVGTGLVGLGTLNSSLSVPYSEALAVSADGSVVAGDSFAVPPNQKGAQAFRWNERDGMVAIPYEAAGYEFLSEATGISGDGTMIVGRGLFDPLSGEGFRWQESTGIVGFGDLPNGSAETRDANAISTDGRVIVGSSTIGPFRWDATNGLLGLTPPAETVPGSALAVSADGSVVVGYFDTPYETIAFRWDAELGMTRLPDWRILTDWSKAFAISGDGSIAVGGASNYAEQGFAFIWDAEHGLRRLSDVLAALGVDLTGWTLSSATGISADGARIIGNGFDPEGNQAAWIAVIPEPGTALLTAFGIALLAGFGKWPSARR